MMSSSRTLPGGSMTATMGEQKGISTTNQRASLITSPARALPPEETSEWISVKNMLFICAINLVVKSVKVVPT